MYESPLPAAAAHMRERDNRIDALRGLAISLVVLGHSLVRMVPARMTAAPGLQFEAGLGWVPVSLMANPLLNVIYSFHMPLFAFLSGFVLFGSSVDHGWLLVRRRFLALMVPYFAWMFVAWALHGQRSFLGLASFMGAGVLNDQADGSLWFLYALFMCIVVFALVRAVSKSAWALAASALAIGVLGVLPLVGWDHVLGLSEVAWIYPFFVAGFIAAERRRVLDGFRWGLVASIGIWILSLPFVWPVSVTGPRWWFAPAATMLSAAHIPLAFMLSKAVWAGARLVGALGGILVCYYAYGYLGHRALAIQGWIGRRSLGIYATHGFFLLSLGLAAGWMRVTVMFVIAMVGGIAVTTLVERFFWTRIVFLGLRPTGHKLAS